MTLTVKCPRCRISLTKAGNCPVCSYSIHKQQKKFESKSIIQLVIIASLLAFGGWWYSSDFSLGETFTQLVSRFKGRLQIEPPLFKVVGGTKPTFAPAELMEFRRLFENRNFESLTLTATAIQNALEEDLANEYKSFDFYGFFETGVPAHESLFSKWINYTPDHYAPYLARAHYYYQKGWLARGTKFANETDEQQFSEMRGYFLLCEKDIDTALAINPYLITAYSMLLGIVNAAGSEENENMLIKTASSLFPSSFLLYHHMLLTKLPRWGGSWEEMSEIAQMAYRHREENEEVYLLFGEIYIKMARNLRDEEKYEEALALTGKALEYGDHYSFYEEQARIYTYTEEHNMALDAINKAISLRPNASSPYLLRASIYAALDEPEKAIADLEYIEERFPLNSRLGTTRKRCASKFLSMGRKIVESDNSSAIRYYDKALMIQKCFGRAYHLKGHAYAVAQDFDNAVAELEQAIRCGERDITTFQLLDYCLASQKRWDEILKWWELYLEWDPENGEVYLERAGTYKHMGDMQNSLADLERACNLGQKKACSLRKQYQ